MISNQDKWILVTGGAGYIGSHVVRCLSEASRKVVVFDNLSTGFKESLINNEKLVVGDLNNPAEIEDAFSKFNIETVFHFAAKLIVEESVKKPLDYFENNVSCVINLLKACAKFKVKHFIFSSTAAVYGESGSEMVNEETPPNPINPYAASKLMAENILKFSASAIDMKYVILRYFNVAGADPLLRIGQRTKNATHIIKAACEVALGRRKYLEIFGNDYNTPDGTGVRDFIHVEDLAKAHLAGLTYLEEGGLSEIFNCGYGQGYSVLDVVRTLESLLGKKVPIVIAPRRAGDIASVVSNPGKIIKNLGWHSSYNNLSEILKSSYEWENKLQLSSNLPDENR